MERFYLNVPFEEKDIAKSRGAKFDGISRQWYYTNPRDEMLFEEWKPKTFITYSELSDEQQELIKRAKDGENVLVDACIGSGKTTAIQVLCNQFPEKKILYLTYNKLLKVDAREKIRLPNSTVTNYHGFAYKVLRQNGIRAGQSDLIHKFNLSKPITSGYNLLVIDEYQDIELEIADMLEHIKKCNPDIQIIAVGDMQQKIYDKTTLNVENFIDQFLGKYSKLKFTKCFRLCETLATKLGNIWGKTINGVNSQCQVLTMSLEDVTAFLAGQKLSNILCLGARNGIMSDVLNSLEEKYPSKFNKKTVYASIKDSEDGCVEPKSTSAIFTTYDGSKGLERKICVVFDYSQEFWKVRSDKPYVKYEILRNIFCVAASRGKEKIIFVKKEKEHLLSEKDLSTPFEENVPSVKITPPPFLMSTMFDFKYKEDVNECYYMLKTNRIQEASNIINIKENDELIDLSPCIGIYQEAVFFKNYDLSSELSFVKEFSDLHVNLPENPSIGQMILALTVYETSQKRYWSQVKEPFVSDYEKKLLIKRLSTVFKRKENIQTQCQFCLEDANNVLYSFEGRTDVIKNNIVYELKFVSELKHEHFLQLACYLVALHLEKGILWNVRNNEMYEVFIPDRKKFVEAVLKTVTKGSADAPILKDELCRVKSCSIPKAV